MYMCVCVCNNFFTQIKVHMYTLHACAFKGISIEPPYIAVYYCNAVCVHVRLGRALIRITYMYSAIIIIPTGSIEQT